MGVVIDTETGQASPVPDEYFNPVPEAVTQRQARLALLEAGLLSNVSTIINAMQSPAKEVASIEWEYASQIRRDSPLITSLGGALGLTSEEIDDLFLAANLK